MEKTNKNIIEYFKNDINNFKALSFEGKIFALSEYFGIYIEVYVPWILDTKGYYNCKIQEDKPFGFAIIGNDVYYESYDEKYIDYSYPDVYHEALNKATELIEHGTIKSMTKETELI